MNRAAVESGAMVNPTLTARARRPAGRVPRARRPLAVAVALALAGGCAGPDAPGVEGWNEGSAMRGEILSTGERALATELVTHGQVARRLEADLARSLDQILAATLPQIADLLGELALAVEEAQPPERIATNHPALRGWGAEGQQAYRARIEASYDEAQRRLEAMEEAALEAAHRRAALLAAERSPLDEGPTGDPALDGALSTFAEVLSGAIGLDELELRRSQDLQRGEELFEAFSSFAAEGVEARLGGRLLLFVGGDEAGGSPRAALAFCDRLGRDPAGFGYRQAVRYRVLRGAALVADLGWRPMPTPQAPGVPATVVLDDCLFAPHVEPGLDRSAPGFDQLRDMRVVADVQSALVDASGGVLGGIDWRLEFNVSVRGDLTWQPSGIAPVWDEHCTEVKRVCR